MIGPNQEVNRRKYKQRSGSGSVEVISTTPIHAFPNSSFLSPIRNQLKALSLSNSRAPQNKESSSSLSTSTSQATTPTDQITSLPISVHGSKPLRNRDNTSYADKLPRRLSNDNNCPAPTPVSSTNLSGASTSNSVNNASSQDVSINGLRSSVNMYLIATNRIASGRKAIVKGKRISPDGRVEYLIEWDDGES